MFGKALLAMTEEKVSGIAERISNLLHAARTNQRLEQQLSNAKNPAQYVEVANSYGHVIDLNDVAIFITLYKSEAKWVTIINLTGDSLLIRNWGKVSVAHLLLLCEEHGVVRPFCNLSDNPTKSFLGIPTNLNSRKYKLGQCFLPRGYFAHPASASQ